VNARPDEHCDDPDGRTPDRSANSEHESAAQHDHQVDIDSHGHSQRGGGRGHGHGHNHAGGWGRWLPALFRPHSHAAADSMDAAFETSRQGIRAVKLSLIGLGATAVAQALVVALTGSVALLADTIHNFTDALTAVPLWVAFILGRRPASRRYTYGFGRAEDPAGIFIVVMIGLSALVAGWESIRRLLDPQPLTHAFVVIVAGLIGFAGNEIVASYRIGVGRRIGSAALVADGLHSRTDGFTSLAVVLGAIGAIAGFSLADPLVGVLITVAILFILRSAVVDIYRRLMDAVDPSIVGIAERTLTATSGVVEVEAVRLRWVGHRIRAEAGISVDPTLSVVEAHAVTVDAHHRLLHEIPKLIEATVHVGPAG
jgi:cation diffusion facilitator family transporter